MMTYWTEHLKIYIRWKHPLSDFGSTQHPGIIWEQVIEKAGKVMRESHVGHLGRPCCPIPLDFMPPSSPDLMAHNNNNKGPCSQDFLKKLVSIFGAERKSTDWGRKVRAFLCSEWRSCRGCTASLLHPSTTRNNHLSLGNCGANPAYNKIKRFTL